jgi:hypothetical protein
MVLIGVDLDDERAGLDAFREKHGIAFPVAVEEEDRMRKEFGIPGCPATVIVDRKGRMIGRSSGGDGDWSSPAARALVRSVLGTGTSTHVARARTTQARKAVHLISAVAPNDPKLTQILDEAASSLKAGDDVEILFDAQSVGALRMSGRKAALEDAPFTARQQRAAAKRLGIPQSDAPHNQFEYIQKLAKAGAKVLVNENAIHAFGLADDEIHPVARRVPVEDMEKIVDESDACLNYSRE